MMMYNNLSLNEATDVALRWLCVMLITDAWCLKHCIRVTIWRHVQWTQQHYLYECWRRVWGSCYRWWQVWDKQQLLLC